MPGMTQENADIVAPALRVSCAERINDLSDLQLFAQYFIDSLFILISDSY
jgi:hypothetical protein